MLPAVNANPFARERYQLMSASRYSTPPLPLLLRGGLGKVKGDPSGLGATMRYDKKQHYTICATHHHQLGVPTGSRYLRYHYGSRQCERRSLPQDLLCMPVLAADEQTSRRADLHLEQTSTEHGTMTRQPRDFRF